MKALRHLLPILFLAPFLVQCATTQDVRSLDLRIRTLNNKMISTDRNVSDLQADTTNRANKSSVENLQKNLADSANTVDYLKTQLLQLQGQVEESGHQVQKLQEDEKYYRDSLSTRLHDLSEGVENLRVAADDLQKKLSAVEQTAQDNNTALQQLSGEVEKIKSARAAEAAAKAQRAAEEAARIAREAQEAKARKAAVAARIAKEEEAARARAKSSAGNGGTRVIAPAHSKKTVTGTETATTEGKTAAKATPAPKPAPAPVAKPAPASKAAANPEQKLYDEGLADFTTKKFKEAYDTFSRYLDKYPKGNLAGNARFWLGDSLYNQGKYELAILEYQKVIADFPNHPKCPAALLKQGLAFEKLKDLDTAKLVYYKLDAEYPKSEEASAAKKRLDSIK